MKKYIFSCLVMAVLSAVSCKRAFEDHPLELVTEDYIWDKNDATGTYADQWLAHIYSRLPSGWTRLNDVMLDCVTDDAVPSQEGNATWNTIRGGYNAYSLFDDTFGSMYAAIRESNIFLNNYQVVPFADPNSKKWFPAETRALRAFFYFELVKRYGGVPLIGEQVYASNDPALSQLKRNSFEECINYIVTELDAVKDDLRPEATLANRGSGNGANGTDGDAGRIRKSVVLAIKAKVLLYAASPLFNPSTTPELAYTGYPLFDVNRWKVAADAAKAVMDLNLFALEPNRNTFSVARVNKEFIWTRMGGGGQNKWSYVNSPVGYKPGNTASEGRMSPTQELVDAFPMKNGKPIDDLTSGYNSADPYANRDPRLGQTVFVNGSLWLKRNVETFEGGLDKPNNVAISNVQTLTGYYCKKLLPDDSNNTGYTVGLYHATDPSVWPYIRYADILLMYAEAMNEFSGPDASIYAAVQAVRQRAGLVPFALPLSNQLQMQGIIRNERRVEFAFEEQRFYDIRRWKIADKTYGKTLHGVTIVKNANNTFTYTLKNVVTPFFSNAMYLLPFANKETLANPNLKQNPSY